VDLNSSLVYLILSFLLWLMKIKVSWLNAATKRGSHASLWGTENWSCQCLRCDATLTLIWALIAIRALQSANAQKRPGRPIVGATYQMRHPPLMIAIMIFHRLHFLDVLELALRFNGSHTKIQQRQPLLRSSWPRQPSKSSKLIARICLRQRRLAATLVTV